MKISFKSFVIDTIAFFGSLLVLNFVFEGWTLTLQAATNAGITAIIFGLLFRRIFMFSSKKLSEKQLQKIVIELQADEKLLFEGGASHFKGPEAVGGKLALTSKRLIFKSHKLNIQNHSEAIFINDIREVKASKVKSDDENILTLQLSNNEVERFVVYHPSQWVENIVQQKRVA